MPDPILTPLLNVGDVITIAGRAWVVASATGAIAAPPSHWLLYLVPEGQAPLDLGKTWTRNHPGTMQLTMIRPTAAPVTTDLEPPIGPGSPGSPGSPPDA